MARKILSGILTALGSILLILSIAGIGMIWIYKGPLTRDATARLRAVDHELGQAQTDFQNARLELERTLRLVDAAESSMGSLKKELNQVKTLFDNTNGMLNNQLLPGLIASRGKIDQAKTTLQGLRASLAKINSLPLLNLPGDKLLGDLIGSADSLDAQIVHVEDLVKSASTFASDASYLMGADFTETKTNLANLLSLVTDYDQKITNGRTQLDGVLGSLPGWITGTAIGLTIFLLWFGFSQASLVLHGLALWRGDNPLAVLRKPVVDDFQV